jgi:DNA end-binding protein Ku
VKSIWKGNISFGLVTIPVRLYSAVQEHVLGFKLLHEKCHTPIAYKRWCDHCKKEVGWTDVVKGLKQEDGSYVILTQEKIKELKPEKTDQLAIIEFVNADQIEPIYLEHHFYLGPEKQSQNAFYLFKKALEQSGKAAIGKFVMRDKEYVCVINPYEQTLLLTTLNYAYEIRSLAEVPNLKAIKSLSASELKLAKQLIDQLTVKTFKLEQFKDTFAQQLKAAIKKDKKQKVKKVKEKALSKVKKEKGSSLSHALRASLIAPSRSSYQPHARAHAKKKGTRA